MATNLSATSPLTSAQDVGKDYVEQPMKRRKLCPREFLASLSHLRIDPPRIKPIQGQAPKMGGKADVEAATLDSGQPSTSLGSEVTEYFAVKKMRFGSDTDDDRVLGLFAREVSLLADLCHENVVKIVGFVEDTESGIAWMVFRWEKNGNLREFVRSAQWELPERISLINDVARGLSYLHGRNPPICHGDLKSLNILVNSGNRAVITDFGSARAIESGTETSFRSGHTTKATKTPRRQSTGLPGAEPLKAVIAESGEFITMTGPAWTVRWAAPELLDGALTSLGSDIWAFGWICWEAITGNFPFDDTNEATAIRRITAHDIPALYDDSHFTEIKTLCSLMEDCLRFAANERPAAQSCQQMLEFMHQTIPLRRTGDDWTKARSSGLLRAIGWIQLANSMAPKAREYFGQSLEVARSVGDELGQARAMTAIGEAYRLQNEYSEAEKSYIQSRDLYSKIGDQLGFAQSVWALGDVYRMRCEYWKAEESYIQSRDLYSKIGSQLGFAQSVWALGEVYRMRNEYPKAETLYIQSSDLYSKIGSQLGFAQSAKVSGDRYRMGNEYSKAEESYIRSRDLYSKIGDQLGVAQSVWALGEVYRMRNEYSKAEESYIQSRDLYSKIGSQLGLAQSVKVLGEVYQMRNEYSKAEDSYIQSRDLYSKIGDRLGFAQSVRALGEVYRMRNEYPKAEESYIQARDVYCKLGCGRGFAQSVLGLGDVYLIRNEYSKAEESYFQSHGLYSQVGDQLGLAQALQAIGHLHKARKEYGKAAESYLEAQAIYDRIRDRRSLANIYWFLAWVRRDQAQYEEAERMVREAAAIYREIGMKNNVANCDRFIANLQPFIQRVYHWGRQYFVRLLGRASTSSS